MLGITRLNPGEVLAPIGENEGIRIILTSEGKQALKQGLKQGLIIGALINVSFLYGRKQYRLHTNGKTAGNPRVTYRKVGESAEVFTKANPIINPDEESK